MNIKSFLVWFNNQQVQTVVYLKINCRTLFSTFLFLFICLFIYLSIYLSTYLSIYLAIYLSIYLSIYLFIHSFIHLFVFVSPVPEMRAEVGSFPGIVLHPPLPPLMHPQDPSAKPHPQSSQAELDTHQTSAEPSPSALSGSTIGPPPPLLLQPTPPYEHTVDSDSQTSKIQDSTAQLSTVFSV